MYALVEIKGKQYKALPGKTLKIDLLNEEEGSTIECDKVLLLSNGVESVVGQPYIAGAHVKLSLGPEIKDKKLRVFKYKRRKKYRLTQGHRQRYRLVTVSDIQGNI